jgi:hypothetical protein
MSWVTRPDEKAPLSSADHDRLSFSIDVLQGIVSASRIVVQQHGGDSGTARGRPELWAVVRVFEFF